MQMCSVGSNVHSACGLRFRICTCSVRKIATEIKSLSLFHCASRPQYE